MFQVEGDMESVKDEVVHQVRSDGQLPPVEAWSVLGVGMDQVSSESAVTRASSASSGRNQVTPSALPGLPDPGLDAVAQMRALPVPVLDELRIPDAPCVRQLHPVPVTDVADALLRQRVSHVAALAPAFHQTSDIHQMCSIWLTLPFETPSQRSKCSSSSSGGR